MYLNNINNFDKLRSCTGSRSDVCIIIKDVMEKFEIKLFCMLGLGQKFTCRSFRLWLVVFFFINFSVLQHNLGPRSEILMSLLKM